MNEQAQQNVVLESLKERETDMTTQNQESIETNVAEQTPENKPFDPQRELITEDIATHKLVILANELLRLPSFSKHDFRVLIGYLNIPKLLYSDCVNLARKNDKIQNSFGRWDNFLLQDISYCLGHEDFYNESQLYFCSNLDEDSYEFCELTDSIDWVEIINPQNISDASRKTINIVDLMSKDLNFKNAILYHKLISTSFFLDVKFSKNGKIKSNSELRALFHFLYEPKNEKARLLTFTWSFDVKRILSKKSFEPRFNFASISIEELINDEYFFW